jgi:hypothetical protein
LVDPGESSATNTAAERQTTHRQARSVLQCDDSSWLLMQTNNAISIPAADDGTSTATPESGKKRRAVLATEPSTARAATARRAARQYQKRMSMELVDVYYELLGLGRLHSLADRARSITSSLPSLAAQRFTGASASSVPMVRSPSSTKNLSPDSVLITDSNYNREIPIYRYPITPLHSITLLGR